MRLLICRVPGVLREITRVQGHHFRRDSQNERQFPRIHLRGEETITVRLLDDAPPHARAVCVCVVFVYELSLTRATLARTHLARSCYLYVDTIFPGTTIGGTQTNTAQHDTCYSHAQGESRPTHRAPLAPLCCVAVDGCHGVYRCEYQAAGHRFV